MKTTKSKYFNTRQLVMTAVFTALICISGLIVIPLPLIQLTLQILITTMAGLILGGVNGFIAVLAYIALGLMGLPVFSLKGGLQCAVSPSFGYIIGFAIGTLVGGLFAEKSSKKTFSKFFVANLINLSIVYIIGVLGCFLSYTFYLKTGITAKTLFISSFLIFIPLDLIKCFLSAYLAVKINKVKKMQG